jgi:mannose-6-phosphate isomerase-like protein (cupin superfamily)
MNAIVLKRGEGKLFSRPTTHGSVTVKIANRASTSFETERVTDDGGGLELQSHPGFDETLYVVSGEWEFVAGNRRFVADSGTTVYLPRGIFHVFRHTGRLEGKLFGVAVPGGIEEFFEEADLGTHDEREGATSLH